MNNTKIVPNAIINAYWAIRHLIGDMDLGDIVAVDTTALVVRRVRTPIGVIEFGVTARAAAFLEGKTLPAGVKISAGLPLEYSKCDYHVPAEEIQPILSRYQVLTNPRRGDYVMARLVVNDIKRHLAGMEPKTTPVKEKTWAEGSLTEDEAAFEQKCQKHDWYYGYSDSASVWNAGEASHNHLQAEITRIGGNAKQIYDFYKK